MARPVEESMKFSLQSVKISTQIRKKMIDSAYLDNANLTSVTLTPNSRRPLVSTQPYGYLQESYIELQKQLKNEQQQVKSVSDCEVELRICFDSVPQIFFDSDFDLSDPVMFSVVLDPNEHFKLTGYLDLVEVCLNEQISIQSDSLFAAIKQLQEFQVHVSETLQAIHGLSGSMQAIQSRHTIPPLLIPVYLRRIQNLRKVQKIVLF
ncbi:uncharacterized protein [Blastocystis hominis]|uniref:Uncharacterized protein n=1 Tax=Blastocystis hominis TaxID=12968 RepID=D8M4I5_BLAHO|nr:uncharacterized protein [Blastocystis hominis]CBK22974.2 unnamed protein product [Blastocystis hominis]|eukprot:XP_012897022.1 uncharacterized protein [Blastocystis hominis]